MARSIPRTVGTARRPRFGLWLLVLFLAIGALGQAVPLYTDWLWFKEVGFTQVFTTRLTLNGWLFLGLGGVVFVFLFLNLSVAARTAPARRALGARGSARAARPRDPRTARAPIAPARSSR